VQNRNRIYLVQRGDGVAQSISTRGATFQISCVLQQTVHEWRSCEEFLLLNKRLSEDVTAFVLLCRVQITPREKHTTQVYSFLNTAIHLHSVSFWTLISDVFSTNIHYLAFTVTTVLFKRENLMQRYQVCLIIPNT